jgi:hypothetical protein
MAESVKAQQWAKRIAAFERSGLKRHEWCTQEGVKTSTLDYWRTRLRDPKPGLVPIVVGPAQERGGDMLSGIELELLVGVRVRAAIGVEAAWLSALIRGIAGC